MFKCIGAAVALCIYLIVVIENKRKTLVCAKTESVCFCIEIMGGIRTYPTAAIETLSHKIAHLGAISL